VIAACTACVLIGHAYAASFDCSKARSTNEHLICDDRALSRLDDQLGELYRKAKAVAVDPSAFAKLNEAEYRWREAHCADRKCLSAWYERRFAQLTQISVSGRVPSLSTVGAIPSDAPPPGAISVTAVELFSAYQSNELAADARFKGKKIAVRGIVERVARDITGAPYVALAADGYGVNTVNAYFSPDAADRLANVPRGSDITLTCIGNGEFLDSPLLDCRN
jgi:uncharacterized protein